MERLPKLRSKTVKTAEEIGEDANELDKALKSVTGLGESAAKAWGKLFGGD